MKKLLLFLWPLLPAGCASYEVPLCNEQNRKDVPNLEGRFTSLISMVSKTGSVVERTETTISRLDRGRYFIEGRKENSRAEVCEIEGHLYAENRQGWNLFPAQGWTAFLLNPNTDGSFDLVTLGIDSKILDERRIPYRVVDLSGILSGRSETNNLFSILVDNRNVAPEQLVQFLDPMSLKFTLRPDSGK